MYSNCNKVISKVFKDNYNSFKKINKNISKCWMITISKDFKAGRSLSGYYYYQI